MLHPDQLIDRLQQTPFLHGLSTAEISKICQGLLLTVKTYHTGEYLHRSGDIYSTIGIILAGKASMISIDFWGNQNLIREFVALDHYGDAHSITKTPMFFDIVATEDSQVAFLDIDQLLHEQNQSDPTYQKLLTNLTLIMAQRKIYYMRNNDLLGKRTTRGKVMAFLTDQARIHNSTSFCIPFNRQHLADFLAVDRSALSRELSKMQNEGIISFKGNCFRLYDNHDGKPFEQS